MQSIMLEISRVVVSWSWEGMMGRRHMGAFWGAGIFCLKLGGCYTYVSKHTYSLSLSPVAQSFFFFFSKLHLLSLDASL